MHKYILRLKKFPETIRLLFRSIAPLPEETLHFLLSPSALFWALAFLGLVIRLYLVLFTNGTYDVNIWQEHAQQIAKIGLIEYYHKNIEMNHPPFIGIIVCYIWKIAQATGLNFKILFRLPFVLIDIATAMLILLSLKHSRFRFLTAISYWLYPLAIIFSAYHGNTDSSIPFFILLSVYLLSKNNVVSSAIILAISLWVKLPALLTLPAFFFAIPDWKSRFKFFFTFTAIAMLAYTPAFLLDFNIVFKNVFAYHGQLVQTSSGNPVWGMRIFLVNFSYLPFYLQKLLFKPVTLYLEKNTVLCILCILFWSWSRRTKNKIKDLALTITGTYTILYGLSIYWSFQYFAWSLPFWFLAAPLFSIPASLLTAAYIYGLYWFVCGNPWLRGQWDFMGHPYWPTVINNFRNIALLFFFFGALGFLFNALGNETAGFFNWLNKKCLSRQKPQITRKIKSQRTR